MKFIHLPTEVEAEQVLHSFLLHIPGGQILVKKGEWVIKSNGCQWKVDNESFWSLYRVKEKEEKK